MRPILMLLGGLLLGGLVAGCGGESREDLITGTVNFMKKAGTQLGEIKDQVNEAVEKAKKEQSTQLDLTAAIKTTEELKKTGQSAENIKGQLEAQRGQITEAARTENAESKRADINSAYQTLVRQQDELHKALDAAVRVSATETRKLQDKLREAMGPFETLSRQSS